MAFTGASTLLGSTVYYIKASNAPALPTSSFAAINPRSSVSSATFTWVVCGTASATITESPYLAGTDGYGNIRGNT